MRGKNDAHLSVSGLFHVTRWSLVLPIFPVSGVGFFLVVESDCSVASSSIDGHLGWSCILATVETAAADEDTQASEVVKSICEHHFLAPGFLPQF